MSVWSIAQCTTTLLLIGTLWDDLFIFSMQLARTVSGALLFNTLHFHLHYGTWHPSTSPQESAVKKSRKSKDANKRRTSVFVVSVTYWWIDDKIPKIMSRNKIPPTTTASCGEIMFKYCNNSRSRALMRGACIRMSLNVTYFKPMCQLFSSNHHMHTQYNTVC